MNADHDIRVGEAEADTAAFSLLAAFYNINPDKAFIEAVGQLSPDEIEDEEAKTALSLLATYISALPSFNEEALLDLKREWTKLFRGISSDYGPKPPYEHIYAGGEPEMLSKLAQLYLDNDYAEYQGLDNRHDYIGTELGFLVKLSILRTEALAAGNEPDYAKYTEVSDNFLENHLSKWWPKFHEEAVKHTETDFYKGVLRLTSFVLQV